MSFEGVIRVYENGADRHDVRKKKIGGTQVSKCEGTLIEMFRQIWYAVSDPTFFQKFCWLAFNVYNRDRKGWVAKDPDFPWARGFA